MLVTKNLLQKQIESNSSQSTNRILIAIPVFNEFKYVNNLLRAVSKYSEHILVVDDGSTDGTSDILSKYTNIIILSHKSNEGYGKSLMDAFVFAYRHNFEWIITLDCDYQHEPSYIPKFYIDIKNNNTDIISGSRYLSRTIIEQAPPPERVAINRKITEILNQHMSMKLTDAFCGFKAYRTSALTNLQLTIRGYGLPLQLWIQAKRANLRIREIPVPLIYHDPNRKFCGIMEEAQERLSYYLGIIERELGYRIDQNITKSYHSQRKRYSVCKA